MKNDHELTLCECCMMALVNGDTSGCRDYWNHDHPDLCVPADTVPGDTEGQEWLSHFDTRCDGHGGTIEYGARYFTAYVLVPV